MYVHIEEHAFTINKYLVRIFYIAFSPVFDWDLLMLTTRARATYLSGWRMLNADYDYDYDYSSFKSLAAC